MRQLRKLLFLFIGLLFSAAGYTQQILVNAIRYESEANISSIVLDVSEQAKHRVFVMDKPSRLVIDIKEAKSKPSLKQPSASHPLFSKMRVAAKNESDLRIVVDLKEPVTAKSHKLATDRSESHRLVVNLTGKQNSTASSKAKKSADNLAGVKQGPNADIEKKTKRESKQVKGKNLFVVAIDAGHGGDDPGARGANGTQEKEVTLAIAKRLQGLINGQPGMKAKLVRKGDYYVGLRERMKIARQAGADLFISIHADAYENPEVKGASVYTLSRTGASNEAARWLANSENAKEKVGGVTLDDKDEVLASVLLDLSQSATQQASAALAENVLKNFRSIGQLHYDSVQKAGFAVLKSPDIPSILVETAYISNPSDELNLLSARYQTKMANAIFKGVLNYMDKMEPAEVNRMAKL